MSQISIIIPLFNRCVLIKETLDSLLWQTFQDWECIIVDDGSTDNSIEVINKYLKTDNRFKLIIRDRLPKGAPTCRNIGLSSAVSEFVMFFDSDDIFMPWCLEGRMKGIAENADFDAYFSQGLMVYKEKEPKFRANSEVVDYLLEIANFRTSIPTSSPTWRKSFLSKKIFWLEGLPRWQDPVFHVNCLVQNVKYIWIQKTPDHLIRSDYTDKTRITGTGGSFSVFDQLLKGFIEVYSILPEKYKNDFKSSIINKVWKVSFFLTKIQIINIKSMLIKADLMSKKEATLFEWLSLINLKFKKTPILRGLAYNLILTRIKNETDNNKENKISDHILEEFNNNVREFCSNEILLRLSQFNLQLRNNHN